MSSFQTLNLENCANVYIDLNIINNQAEFHLNLLIDHEPTMTVRNTPSTIKESL